MSIKARVIELRPHGAPNGKRGHGLFLFASLPVRGDFISLQHGEGDVQTYEVAALLHTPPNEREAAGASEPDIYVNHVGTTLDWLSGLTPARP